MINVDEYSEHVWTALCYIRVYSIILYDTGYRFLSIKTTFDAGGRLFLTF